MAELRHIFKLIENTYGTNLSAKDLSTHAKTIEEKLKDPNSQESKDMAALMAAEESEIQSAKQAAESERNAELAKAEAAEAEQASVTMSAAENPGEELTAEEAKTSASEKVADEKFLNEEWTQEKQKAFNKMSRGQRLKSALEGKNASHLKPYIQRADTRQVAHLVTDLTESAGQEKYEDRIERRNEIFGYCRNNDKKAEVLYRCPLTKAGHQTRSELLANSSGKDIQEMLGSLDKTITKGKYEGQSQRVAFLDVTHTESIATATCLAGPEHTMPYLPPEKAAIVLNHLVTGNYAPTSQPPLGGPNATQAKEISQQTAVKAAVVIADAEDNPPQLGPKDPKPSLQKTFERMDSTNRMTLMEKAAPEQSTKILNKLEGGMTKEIFPQLSSQQQTHFLNIKVGESPSEKQNFAFNTIANPEKQVNLLKSDPALAQNQRLYTEKMDAKSADALAREAQKQMRDAENQRVAQEAKAAATKSQAPTPSPTTRVEPVAQQPGATPPPLPTGPRPQASTTPTPQPGASAAPEKKEEDIKSRARSISQPGMPPPSPPTPGFASPPPPNASGSMASAAAKAPSVRDAVAQKLTDEQGRRDSVNAQKIGKGEPISDASKQESKNTHKNLEALKENGASPTPSGPDANMNTRPGASPTPR